MRAPGAVLALLLTLAVPPAAGGMGAALADEPDVPPTRAEVRGARSDVREQTRSVATVQADLAAANQQLQESAVRAARASEAWNGARYRLGQAREAAAAAATRAGIARRDVGVQRQAYTDALVETYEMAPELSAMVAIVQSDGIDSVVEQTTTLSQTEAAMETRYDGFRAAATLADVAVEQAADARAEAQQRQRDARQARDRAVAAADAAAAEAQRIAERKAALIEELARLQDISVELAEERQAALEAQEQAEAAAARQAAQEAAERAAAQAAADQAGQADQADQPRQPQQPADDASSGQSAQPQPQPQPEPQPQPQPEPQPQPQPTPPPTPAPPVPSGGVSAAIAFARAQLGEPYQWGAAGPNAWDCSGLTMGAWRAGGRSLPHYSVAQYEQSTPIGSGSLRPGDLVFWGSSSSPSSIYHVALYAGAGQIIHAPRTGRPVTQESMYSWTAPTFFARP